MENILSEEAKLREYFDGMCIKKDSTMEQFSVFSIPSFIRDWFIRKYSDADGNINPSYVSMQIKNVVPRTGDWAMLLDKAISEKKEVRFVGRIEAKRDVKTSELSFALPDFGVNYAETHIPDEVWKVCKESFLKTNGPIWGIITISYEEIASSAKKQVGAIVLKGFQDFRPYKIDLEYYRKARALFTTQEWLNVLLGAVDYNAKGFSSEEEKLYMLLRLLPFVEKRLNLIELAPKGTGKSYVFSKISKRGWLASGGIMTRAKMFYDMNLKQEGLVSNYDYIALDEISTIKFGDIHEMQGALKGYLESGVYTVGIKEGKGDAGVVLLGNIPSEVMNIEENMFSCLPEVFQDSALIDRFHGFIEGWKIPRMNEDRKVNGWALNSEYFAEILHALRDCPIARSVVDQMVVLQEGADTRDVTAVKRICTALMKLIFPHWVTAEDVDIEEFKNYCLNPALRMRAIIKKQLGIMDSEFAGKQMSMIMKAKE